MRSLLWTEKVIDDANFRISYTLHKKQRKLEISVTQETADLVTFTEEILNGKLNGIQLAALIKTELLYEDFSILFKAVAYSYFLEHLSPLTSHCLWDLKMPAPKVVLYENLIRFYILYFRERG